MLRLASPVGGDAKSCARRRRPRWRQRRPGPTGVASLNARTRHFRPPNGLSRSHPNGHVLGLQVLPDSLEASLAAEAGLLDAAEGSCGIGDDALVQTDHPRFDLLADAKRTV